MKKSIFLSKLLLIILVFTAFTSLKSQENIQTTFTATGNQVTVKLKSSNTVSGTFNQFLVSFRYLQSLGINFTVTNSNYTTVAYVSDVTDGVNPLYHNYQFGFTGGANSVTFTAGVEYPVFTFNINGGIGTGTIGLIEDLTDFIWCPNYLFNGFAIDYSNYTDPFYGSLTNSDFNDGYQDWIYRTLSLNIGKVWKSDAATTAWGTASNWSDGIVPLSTDNITILSGANQPIAGAGSVCGKLDIPTGSTVNVADNGDLTVNGNLTIADNNSLIVKSTASGSGSLITNGTVPSGNKVKVERYITAYTSSYDGWRFVSSPVNGGGTHTFTSAAGEDFYSYDETIYLCWQYQASPSFTNGKGYLAAYASSAARTFSGTLNNANVSFSNLSRTPSGQSGWHLLGNPFASALTWNVGSWGLSNVNSFAYVLNGGGSYTTLSSGGIIPAMQGFLVQVSNTTNAITIPVNARTHSATNLLNKSTETERLLVKASSIGNSTYVESIIRTDNNATAGYDVDFDANFLAGLSGVPQLYSPIASNKVSINTVPSIGNNVVSIPMSFIAGDATNYKLSFDGINTFNTSDIILQDLKTNTTQNLVANPVYNFSALASDNVNRFILHFNSAVGVGEVNKVSGSIYSYENDIYVNSAEAVKQISIYNTIGQLIYTVNNPSGLFKYSLDGNSTGYYIVKVITDKNVNSEKVFVK